MGFFDFLSFGHGMSAADQNETLAATRDPLLDFWYGPAHNNTSAGVHVSVDKALTVPVVFACHNVLAESIGSLPFRVFEGTQDGDSNLMARHPLQALINAPAPGITTANFLSQIVWDLASYNNWFGQRIEGDRGTPRALIRLDPKRVKKERLSDGSIRYRYSRPDGKEQIFVGDEVLHIHGTPMDDDNLVGLSPIWLGREVIAAALAQQAYTGRFWTNDATPPYFVRHPGNFKDKKSRVNWLKAFTDAITGANRGKPAVLEYGIDVKTIGSNNRDAQFSESKGDTRLDIIRYWRMQPHKVGILDKATFSNIEQQSLEHVVDTLIPIITLIEQAFNSELIIIKDRFFVEMNLASLLRGDLKSRYEAYAIGRNWGWLSVNDILRLENMNSIGPDGDVYLQPLNMSPAGEFVSGTGSRDAMAAISPRMMQESNDNFTRRESGLFVPRRRRA